MKKLMIAAVALLAVSPAMAYWPGQVEYKVIYYANGMNQDKVGEALFFCDGTIETTGMVTAYTDEEYYGCTN